jgi:hypothetical protein
VVGDYWTVYHFNFDARRAILGIPIYDMEDYFGFRRRLRRPVRAAILDRNESHLLRWSQLAGVRGRMERVTDGLLGYVIDDPVGVHELDLLQSAGQQLPRVH